MTKIKRRLSLLSLAIPATAIIVSTSLTTKIKTGQIYFYNRKFNSTSEALAYLVQNNKIQIEQQKVLGDLERSYINSETGLLNKSLLPNYDASKMHFAYKNAGGGITRDYQKAKNTYFNPGTVVSMYDDGYGNNTFLSEKDAENSMRSKSIVSRIGFYDVDYLNSDKNDNISKIKKRLNPFNMTDVNNYKKNIKEHIFHIIANNLKMDNSQPTSDDYLISNFTSTNEKEKKIKVDTKPTIDLTPIISKKISEYGKGWHFNKGKIYKEFTNQNIKAHLESGSVYMSHTVWSGDKYGSWRGIGFHMANHGTRWSWGNQRPIYNKTAFKEFFNNPSLKGVGFKNTQRVNSIPKSKNMEKDIQNIYSKLKSWLNESNIKVNNSNKMIYKQEILKKQIWQKFGDSAKDVVSNLKANSDADTFQFTKLPNLKVVGWNTGLFDYWNYAKVADVPGGYNFEYKRTVNLEIPSINLKQDKTPAKLLTKLLNWTDSSNTYTFTIKKNGRSLFDVKIGIENDQMVVKDIQLSKDNHKDSDLLAPTVEQAKRFKGFQDPANRNNNIPPQIPVTDEKNIQKYFYWLLTAFYEEIKNQEANKSNLNIPEIFEKYFGDPNRYFGRAKKNMKYRFDADFDLVHPKRKTTIEIKDILKMYVNIINEAYEKYKDMPELLKIMSKNIISPENMLVYGWKDNIATSAKLNFGKYIIKSISEFNASVSSGSLSTVEGMASTRNEWNILKGSVKYTPAHLLVAYDNNGQQVNVGGYKYDNQLLLKFNILLNKEPKRDYQHVYVGNQLVKNVVATIYSLKLEDTMYYFKKFSDVKKFMLKYIQQHSVEI